MKKSTLRTLNNLAGAWFWSTIIGTFYTGLVHVLPSVYQGDGAAAHTSAVDVTLTQDQGNPHTQHYYDTPIYQLHFCTALFLFAEMVINWICIRTVKSHYRPDLHASCGATECHKENIEKKQITLNLQHLKPASSSSSSSSSSSRKGSYTIPANSIYNNNGFLSAPTNGGPLYLMSIPASECCDPTKCKAIGHNHEDDDYCAMEGGDPLKMCRDRSNGMVFPYWSWKPCFICQVHRPPRTHHCILCGTCILKRDHHCFFTGACVGLHNQRHFVVFTFWSFVATGYSLCFAAIYAFNEFMTRNTLVDLFLPATLIRWLMSSISTLDTVMVAVLYSLFWFCFTSMGFLIEQIRLVTCGVTSFEVENKIKIVNTNSTMDNVRSVFGQNWALNFLFPAHLMYPPADDGVHWNHIKL